MSMMTKSRNFNGSNVTKFLADNTQEFFPTCIKEIKEVLKHANENNLTIYPISTGRNWGLGSKVPPDKDSIILNLSEMTEITNYDSQFGVISIEPGVTQAQLSDFLKNNNSKYFIDVTGSSKDTSIIGNILERGISYNDLRVSSLISLEVLLPSGEVIHTGQERFSNSKTKFLYKHGVGPELTGLFLQSNFGIVTKVNLKLHKRKKYNTLVQLNYNSINHFSSSLANFKYLMDDNIIDSIFHLANRERAIGAIHNHLEFVLEQNKVHKKTDPRILLTKALKTPWVATGVISSNIYIVNIIKLIILRAKLKPFCKVTFFNYNLLNVLEVILRVFNVKKIKSLMQATKPFRTLYNGHPTDAALSSVLDLNSYKTQDSLHEKVDLSERGFCYCLPITKLEKDSCNDMVLIIEDICNSFNFTPSITLNPITEDLLEAVVSIDFESHQAFKAHDCIRKLNQVLMQNGHTPYRTDIKNYHLFFGTNKEYDRILKGIKDVFDPNNIISPSRYSPI